MKNSRVKQLKSHINIKNNTFVHFLNNSNKTNNRSLQSQEKIKLSNKGLFLIIFIMIISLIFFKFLGLPEILACIPGIILSISVNNYIKKYNSK